MCAKDKLLARIRLFELQPRPCVCVCVQKNLHAYGSLRSTILPDIIFFYFFHLCVCVSCALFYSNSSGVRMKKNQITLNVIDAFNGATNGLCVCAQRLSSLLCPDSQDQLVDRLRIFFVVPFFCFFQGLI